MIQMVQMIQNKRNFSWTNNNNMGVAWNYAVFDRFERFERFERFG
jgi:hypothetical protein